MKLRRNYIKIVPLSKVIIVSCILVQIHHQCSHGDNLSNVFVLETDSDSTPPTQVPVSSHNNNNQQFNHSIKLPSTISASPQEQSAKVRTVEESNTRIILDDGSATSASKDQNKRVQQEQKIDQSGRKLEETSELHSDHKRNINNQQSQITTSRPRLSTASSSGANNSNHDRQRNSSDEVPAKNEERLLISITSNDNDDEHYGKPQRNPNQHQGSSSLGEDLGSSHSLSQHQHQKRKPSITISIQDANINKQNSGVGSAVIVRPGDDGQSIVIATVNSNPNKYQPSQPPRPHEQSSTGGSSLVGPINGNLNNNNNNNDSPYREPVNNPIQSIINQHQITSTTRRPIYSNDYSSSSGSLSNRPPANNQLPSVTDERPTRPVRPSVSGLVDNDSNPTSSSNFGSNIETSRPPPTSRPEYIEPNESLSSSSSSSTSGVSKYELNERNCGIIQETKIVGGEEADPDDFMWMAAIVKSRPKDGQPKPFCGGSLITRRHVLTAAHCLEGLAPRDVLVRLGSYDFDDQTASSFSADFAIDQFRVPAQYSKKTHVADIAIMRLKTPLSLTDNYKTVCMPQPRRSYVGALGTVTGYGSQSQTFRRAAPKLRQVTVPIWENRKCSTVYKRNLTESFLCAGYEEGGKDACQGDSGGPLMTEGPEQRMMVVGVVSHGIGCGAPGYPGVYTRTTTFMDWIEKNTRE